MKTHFQPYHDEYGDIEVMPCGTKAYFDIPSDTTSNWKHVTCKRCLGQKEKIQKSFEENEKEIVRQMGDMANFYSNFQGRTGSRML